jgi:hypothetical protein
MDLYACSELDGTDCLTWAVVDQAPVSWDALGIGTGGVLVAFSSALGAVLFAYLVGMVTGAVLRMLFISLRAFWFRREA